MLEPLQQQIFLVVLIVAVFAAFVRDWWPVEVVALGALFLCVVAGILPLSVPALPAADWSDAEKLARFAERDEALRYTPWNVFAHPAPLVVACMFVLSAALERTGVVEALGHWFERVAASSPLKMLAVLMLLVAFLSAFMNNTPVVVVFLPIVLAICRRKDWRASRYLIPLSYAAIVGGTVTLVGTSTNLVVAGSWAQRLPDRERFAMFEFAALGLVFVGVAVVYMMTLGRRLLPDRVTLAALIDSEQSREFITHAFLRAESPLVGKAFLDTPLATVKKARVLEVLRNGVRVLAPLPEVVFEPGDEIVLKGEVGGLVDVGQKSGVAIRGEDDIGLQKVRTESAVLMEGIVGRGSSLEGKSLKELDFRQRFGVLILAVHRRGENLKERFEDEKLSFGDTLLVQGPADKMNRLFEMRDFINLSKPRGTILRPAKAPLALAAVAAFMLLGALMGFGVVPDVPVVVLAMGAALFVLVTRCLDPRDAYQSIDWKVLFLIMGMLGLGMAVDRSGLDDVIGDFVKDTFGVHHPFLLVAAFYLLAAVLTEMISNNAVAALLAPIAITVGEAAAVDPKPLVVAIMFGASASFVTPIGYQTNTFVYGAGGYKFGDFFKVGLPLALILWLVATCLIPVLWPFGE